MAVTADALTVVYLGHHKVLEMEVRCGCGRIRPNT